MNFKQMLEKLNQYKRVDAKINEEGEVETITIGIEGDESTYLTLTEPELDELTESINTLETTLTNCGIFRRKYGPIEPDERDSYSKKDILETSDGLYSRVYKMGPRFRVVKNNTQK